MFLAASVAVGNQIPLRLARSTASASAGQSRMELRQLPAAFLKVRAAFSALSFELIVSEKGLAEQPMFVDTLVATVCSLKQLDQEWDQDPLQYVCHSRTIRVRRTRRTRTRRTRIFKYSVCHSHRLGIRSIEDPRTKFLKVLFFADYEVPWYFRSGT